MMTNAWIALIHLLQEEKRVKQVLLLAILYKTRLS